MTNRLGRMEFGAERYPITNEPTRSFLQKSKVVGYTNSQNRAHKILHKGSKTHCKKKSK